MKLSSSNIQPTLHCSLCLRGALRLKFCFPAVFTIFFYLNSPKVSLAHARRPSNNLKGQVVSYMRLSKLRYGFISTFEPTVFIKRDQNYAFHLSMPISKDASTTSPRECFAGFAFIAAHNPNNEEKVGIDLRLVSVRSVKIVQRTDINAKKTAPLPN
jgi:hypothetical protein